MRTLAAGSHIVFKPVFYHPGGRQTPERYSHDGGNVTRDCHVLNGLGLIAHEPVEPGRDGRSRRVFLTGAGKAHPAASQLTCEGAVD